MRLVVLCLFSGFYFFSGTALAATVYFTQYLPGGLNRASVCGGTVEPLVTLPDVGPVPADVELDIANGKVYWTDQNEHLRRSNLDGSNVEQLAIENCGNMGVCSGVGLGLDLIEGKIYWSDGSNIERANLDGTNHEVIVTDTFSAIYDVEVDVGGGKVYWINDGDDSIKRSNLDGSSVETLVTGIPVPIGLGLDLVNGKIYWTDWETDKVQRANLNGSDVEDIITSFPDVFSHLQDIEVDSVNGHIYFIGFTPNVEAYIYRANLDGSGITLEIVNSSAYFLAIDPASPVGPPAVSIQKDADATVVDPGDTVTYTIEVENTGDTCLEVRR